MSDESNKSEEVSVGDEEPPVRRGDEIVAAPKRRMIGKQTPQGKDPEEELPRKRLYGKQQDPKSGPPGRNAVHCGHLSDDQSVFPLSCRGNNPRPPGNPGPAPKPPQVSGSSSVKKMRDEKQFRGDYIHREHNVRSHNMPWEPFWSKVQQSKVYEDIMQSIWEDERRVNRCESESEDRVEREDAEEAKLKAEGREWDWHDANDTFETRRAQELAEQTEVENGWWEPKAGEEVEEVHREPLQGTVNMAGSDGSDTDPAMPGMTVNSEESEGELPGLDVESDSEDEQMRTRSANKRATDEG